MRENPSYALTDEAQVRELVAANPFVTLISATSTGLIASHYPVLVEDGPGLTLLSHVGRPDDERHELGRHEVLVIVTGPQGYVSPGWYGDRSTPAVPTWNFVVAHLYGTPQILGDADNAATLARLVDRFEGEQADPRRLTGTDGEYAERIRSGTVGFRLPVTRFEAKAKLSQDKPPAVVAGVLAGLTADGPYRNPELADAMRRLGPAD
jgi:transcriptional regulator